MLKYELVIILLLIPYSVVFLNSCKKKDLSLTPEGKAHFEVPTKELQRTSRPFQISVILIGNYDSENVFDGKITFFASAKNNTKYTFKSNLTFLFLTDKPVTLCTEDIGDSEMLFTDVFTNSLYWKPGDIITFNEECYTEDYDNEAKCDPHIVEYLTQKRKLPTNIMVKITGLLNTSYCDSLMGMPHPVDCFNPNCPYKELKKDDADYCGEK